MNKRPQKTHIEGWLDIWLRSNARFLADKGQRLGFPGIVADLLQLDLIAIWVYHIVFRWRRRGIGGQHGLDILGPINGQGQFLVEIQLIGGGTGGRYQGGGRHRQVLLAGNGIEEALHEARRFLGQKNIKLLDHDPLEVLIRFILFQQRDDIARQGRGVCIAAVIGIQGLEAEMGIISEYNGLTVAPGPRSANP